VIVASNSVFSVFSVAKPSGPDGSL
jgi:hypothetical protein